MRFLKAAKEALNKIRPPSKHDFDRSLALLAENQAKLRAQLAGIVADGRAFRLWSATKRYEDAKSLSRFEAQIYSQNGEDGLIAEILGRIGARDRFFVEIGVEDGAQNNTRLLLEQGWRGIWIEGDPLYAARAREIFAKFIESGRLRIVESFVTAENVNAILERESAPARFDLLSIDVDQNTSHIWRALAFSARASVIEYNGLLPASVALEVPYDPQAVWDGSNWYGASLKALELIGRAKGLSLVGCDPQGVNAFFVDADEAKELFQEPFTAEQHYEPLRVRHPPNPLADPMTPVAREWIEWSTPGGAPVKVSNPDNIDLSGDMTRKFAKAKKIPF